MAGPRCIVCGNPVNPTSGKHIRFRGRVIHFRCPDCLEYFASDSERFLRQGADRNPCDDRRLRNRPVRRTVRGGKR